MRAAHESFFLIVRYFSYILYTSLFKGSPVTTTNSTQSSTNLWTSATSQTNQTLTQIFTIHTTDEMTTNSPTCFTTEEEIAEEPTNYSTAQGTTHGMFEFGCV
jgi:hypothetical protein